MATLPVVHSAGEGNQSLGALVAPLSIHAVLTAAPAQLVRYIGSMAPRGVWHVGSFGFGAFPGDSANPAAPSIGFTEYLHAETQDALVPELNGGLYTASSLWWRWKPGVTVDLTVTTASSNRDLQPWDRNAAMELIAFGTNLTPNQVNVTLWNYTVPAGRMLRVGTMQCETLPYGLGAAANTASSVNIEINGTQVLVAVTPSSNPDSLSSVASPSDLTLPPGTTLTAIASNTASDTIAFCFASVAGYLFDVLS